MTSGEVAKANAKWVDKEEEGKGENLLGKRPPIAAAGTAGAAVAEDFDDDSDDVVVEGSSEEDKDEEEDAGWLFVSESFSRICVVLFIVSSMWVMLYSFKRTSRMCL